MPLPTVERFIYNASNNIMIAWVFNPQLGTTRRVIDTAAFSKHLNTEACFTSRYFANDLASYFNACPTGRYACAQIGRYLQTLKPKPVSTGSVKEQFMSDRENEYARPDGWPFK